MQDKDLYQQILGLSSPWTVVDVHLDHEVQEIRVRVEHARGVKFYCPECDTKCPCHDHAGERRWRHLDSCQFRTVLLARPPRRSKVPRASCEQVGTKPVTFSRRLSPGERPAKQER